MSKKKILFVFPSQFGYHKDTYSYCRHLDKNRFFVYYIGLEHNLPEIRMPGVRIHLVKRPAIKLLVYIHFIISVISLIRKEKIERIFLIHHRYSLIIRLLSLNKRCILDIRTGYINSNGFKRKINNFTITLSSVFYKKVSIISESLRKKLYIPSGKCIFIPLGSEVRENESWPGDGTPKLLYIGSLNRRNIDLTVVGLSKYVRQFPDEQISYDIIGFGNSEAEDRLRRCISENGLENIVKFHGRITFDDLEFYFKKCNIGVAFVPVVPEYDCQPTTKLFEYLLAGMPVLATSTSENSIHINEHNGILIDDTSDGFCDGLLAIIKKMPSFDSAAIRSSVKDYTWSRITSEILTPIFNH